MRSAVSGTPRASANDRARPRNRPRTEEELYAREEQLALRGLVESGERMLGDLSRTIGPGVRRHPLLAAAIAATGGAAAANAALKLLRATSGLISTSLLQRGAASSELRTLAARGLRALRRL